MRSNYSWELIRLDSLLDTLKIAAVDQKTGIGFVTDYISVHNINYNSNIIKKKSFL